MLWASIPTVRAHHTSPGGKCSLGSPTQCGLAHERTGNGPFFWNMDKSHPSLDLGMIHLSAWSFSLMEGIIYLICSLDQPRDAGTSKPNSYSFVPDPHTKSWAHAASSHRELGLSRGEFWPREGVLPGGGTPEARHSKVTEAFSRTALLTGPGSMLGGTRGLQGETPLGGCGLWAATIPATLRFFLTSKGVW